MPTGRLFQRSPLRALSLIGLLLSGLIGFASSTQAQTSAAPLPAVMYRRAVEAAQSQSAQYSYFVAVAMEGPYEVLAINRELRAAEEAANRTKRRYGMIGPILGGQPMALMSGQLPCKHRPDSYLSCPDTTLRASARDLERIVIVYQSANRSDTVMSFAPDSGDAVFFTHSAMEKFVWPYYERIFGLETANSMRLEYISRYGRP